MAIKQKRELQKKTSFTSPLKNFDLETAIRPQKKQEKQ